jgi:hypothetical protein
LGQGFAVGGGETECAGEGGDGFRAWVFADAALECADGGEAGAGSVRQVLLGQPGSLAVPVEQRCERFHPPVLSAENSVAGC